MEGILKVTPSALKAKSGEFDSVRATIWNLVQDMNGKVVAITSTWQGDASTAYQTSYNGLKDDIDRMNRMISEHVKDLVEMADIYQKAEAAAESANQALPKDAIK